MSAKGLVVLDTDGTVTDGFTGSPRPGIYDILQMLHALGYEVRMWSGAGQGHARKVGEDLKLPFIYGFHNKPRRWNEAASYCVGQMGRVPDLVVDDENIGPLHGIATVQVTHAFELLHPEAVL